MVDRYPAEKKHIRFLLPDMLLLMIQWHVPALSGFLPYRSYQKRAFPAKVFLLRPCATADTAYRMHRICKIQDKYQLCFPLPKPITGYLILLPCNSKRTPVFTSITASAYNMGFFKSVRLQISCTSSGSKTWIVSIAFFGSFRPTALPFTL